MFTEEEKEDLIGMEVGILDALANEYAKITIAEIKTIDDEDIVISSDGVAYSEEQINWHYKLTLGAICMLWLHKQGYLDDDTCSLDGHKYEEQLNSLMDSFVKNGFLSTGEDDITYDNNLTVEDIISRWLYRYGYINEDEIDEHDFLNDYQTLIEMMVKTGYIDK